MVGENRCILCFLGGATVVFTFMNKTSKQTELMRFYYQWDFHMRTFVSRRREISGLLTWRVAKSKLGYLIESHPRLDAVHCEALPLTATLWVGRWKFRLVFLALRGV